MDIVIRDLDMNYGSVAAVQGLNLTVEHGEMLVLLGPSGCGKTSTMRAIVGLEQPSRGTITVGGQTMFDASSRTDVPTNKRRIGMVFQSYAIWPHKTVYQNIAFPLRMQRLPRKDIRQRVNETAELMQLSPLLDRGASRLSGGQMQRVALARSIAMQPTVLLLDEPLSNLDARLRDKLRLDLKELQTRLGITSIYVTHDQGEALSLADRIAVMNKGRLIQVDDPNTLYRAPADLLVADFLGVSNIYSGRLTSPAGSPTSEFELDRVRLRLLTTQTDIAESAAHKVCLRPEAVRLCVPALAGAARTSARCATNAWPGRVSTRSFVGTHTRYRVTFDDSDLTVESVVPAGEAALSTGQAVEVSIAPEDVRVLPC